MLLQLERQAPVFQCHALSRARRVVVALPTRARPAATAGTRLAWYCIYVCPNNPLGFADYLMSDLVVAHGIYPTDFWRRVSSYREQPKVALTYQVLAILEGVSEDPGTHTQEHLTIVQTTFPSRIQRLLQKNTRASQFKVLQFISSWMLIHTMAAFSLIDLFTLCM